MADTKARITIVAADETRAAFASAKANVASLSTAATRVGGAVTAGLAVVAAAGAAVAAAIKPAIDALDQLDDLAEKSGIAVEQLSALKYAGESVGTPIEALATGTRKLAGNMAAAAGGSKEAAAAFAAIGVKVTDTNGQLLRTEDVLAAVADKFASYADGAGKSALAVDLFGKSGEDLIPLLNQGSSGIARLSEEARQLGVVYSGDLAAQAARFNDLMAKTQAVVLGAKVSLAESLLPTLNRIVDRFIEARKAGDGFFQSLKAAQLLALGFDPAKDAKKELAARSNGLDLLRLRVERFNAMEKAGLKGSAEEAAKLRAQYDTIAKTVQQAAATVALLSSDPQDSNDALSRRLGRGDGKKKPDAPVVRKPEAAKDAITSNALTAAEQTAQAVGKLLEQTDVTKAREYADQLALLDRLFFDLGLDANLYDSAVAKLTRTTSAAADLTGEWLKEQREIDDLVRNSSLGVLERQRQQMLLLAKAYEAGRFGLVDSAEAMQTYGTIVNDTLNNIGEDAERAAFSIETIGQAFEASFASAIMQGKGMIGVLQALGQQILGMALNQIGKQLFSALVPSLSSFLPGRASGGPVSAGAPYMVGERGPEVFVPAASGQIVPNHAMGGVTIVDNRTVMVGDIASRADVAAMLQRSNQAQLAAIQRSRTRGGIFSAD